MKDFIRNNPVRVRAAVVAVVALLASVIPALADVNAEAVAGPIVAVVALWAGQSAGRRVVLSEDHQAAELRAQRATAERDAAHDEAMALLAAAPPPEPEAQ
ncbi:hypothetical protein [Kitasatospora purpeofusca]|uniref:hypothetical protein n=1 Tax=Kitasatospora purpeofusca TaxID=67352 RepID=UPI003673C5D0